MKNTKLLSLLLVLVTICLCGADISRSWTRYTGHKNNMERMEQAVQKL